jgi:hypothetical protein
VHVVDNLLNSDRFVVEALLHEKAFSTGTCSKIEYLCMNMSIYLMLLVLPSHSDRLV